jgi:hypothetical protein
MPAAVRGSAPPRLLRVTVTEVFNPRRLGLTLQVSRERGSIRQELARFTFFPPDRAGSFVARLPEPLARELASQRQGLFTCVLLAEPGVGLEGVRVRVQGLELLPEP